MPDAASGLSVSPEWLPIDVVADQLGISVSRVRRLVEDRVLATVRRDGALVVPAGFLVDGEPMSELRGTLIVLEDAGFHGDEAVEWLLAIEDSLGVAPIEALRQGRKAEVRRVAQALG